jgi:hypothetical protein
MSNPLRAGSLWPSFTRLDTPQGTPLFLTPQVDIRDRTIPQLTYVPEENIEVMTNRRVTHPGLEDYFEGFDGAQYLPRPWLKTIYPMDN